MMRPRILYIIGQLARGGAEQQLYYLLKYLRPEAQIIALREGGYWAQPIRALGYDVIELRRRGRADVSRLLGVIRAIRAYRPDIIHVVLDNVYGLYGRVAALLTGHHRVIVGERSHPTFNPIWYNRLRGLLLNRFIRYVVANSHAARDYLVQQMNLPDRKAKFIPNGIELDRIVSESQQGDYPLPIEWKGATIIGSVGHLTPAKAPDIFVSVAQHVMNANPNVRFVFVGDGELQSQIQAMCADLQLQDRIFLAGQQLDVPRWLAAFDIFLMTSRFEGTPNALMEAMAVGLPCVVTDSGGCRELVTDGVNGYVVPIGDETGLAERLLRLVNDGEQRRMMAKNGRQIIADYDVTAMACKYRALYEDCYGASDRKT